MPSNKVLEAKKQVVEELAGKLQTAVSGVLVKYEGITVADDTALRTALRKAEISLLRFGAMAQRIDPRTVFRDLKMKVRTGRIAGGTGNSNDRPLIHILAHRGNALTHVGI